MISSSRKTPAITFILTKEVAARPDHDVGHFNTTPLHSHYFDIERFLSVLIIGSTDPLLRCVGYYTMQLRRERSQPSSFCQERIVAVALPIVEIDDVKIVFADKFLH